MRPFWAPLSTLVLVDPPLFPSPWLIRQMISGGRTLQLLYAGDRMWPAIRHGQVVSVRSPGEGDVEPGCVVLAAPGGVPDLLRVESRKESAVILRADADPGTPIPVQSGEILARAGLPRRRTRAWERVIRRWSLDFQEAVRGKPDPSENVAETVRWKYDAQASFYARAPGEDLEKSLLSRVRLRVPPGGTILVAGSGAGRECFALAAQGWTVRGVDFSAAMIEQARREATRRGVEMTFLLSDLREHDEPPASLQAVLFTYEVYSFLPGHGARVRVLEKMSRWLAPEGVIFLSARRVAGPYQRLILSLQWLSSIRRQPIPWGQSHTRWIALDGRLHRSFIQLFRERSLRREVEEAGLTMDLVEGGHALLRKRSGSP